MDDNDNDEDNSNDGDKLGHEPPAHQISLACMRRIRAHECVTSTALHCPRCLWKDPLCGSH